MASTGAFVPRPITDNDELLEYQSRRRKEFEDQVIGVKGNNDVWVRYAQWEALQKDFRGARAIWERALVADDNVSLGLWIKYAQAEMENDFVCRARKVWDRAVKALPCMDKLWYKYANMEEKLGHVQAARRIYERWMGWLPDHCGWVTYVIFEFHHNEIERAREIMERYVQCHPKVVRSWTRCAKFELDNGDVARAREFYERAVDNLADYKEEDVEQLFVKFARFEERNKEVERTRCIYDFGFSHVPKGRAKVLDKNFMLFEKRYGQKEGIKCDILEKKRFQYEEELRKNPFDYDTWFDYIRLEERIRNMDKIHNLYERATANVPHHYSKPYIYLWINYALFTELVTENMDRTRQVYKKCLELMAHYKFSFAKIWMLAAQFELRQNDLPAASRILGNPVQITAKDKIFRNHIELETKMGNLNRCRSLHNKYLERTTDDKSFVWLKDAEMEQSLSENEKAGAIFGLTTVQSTLDMPNFFWEKYIGSEPDYEMYNRLKLKKRKKSATEYEEYYEYVFPEKVAPTTTMEVAFN
ncbi:hypothetical protein IFM89_030366 [Coptis chinensis]|uniref:Crooked neck protein n=1 Tax=Coptis chinensis TaxID=261450 RepID=A0A835GZ10_9MAGN|nr:hypothetical protein IFM89_030366 [Coptis chinensis]